MQPSFNFFLQNLAKDNSKIPQHAGHWAMRWWHYNSRFPLSKSLGRILEICNDGFEQGIPVLNYNGSMETLAFILLPWHVRHGKNLGET